MKIAANRIDGFIRKPEPGCRAALIYGPDDGLVRERIETLIEAVAGSRDDPFRVSRIDARTLDADPARLGDEAASFSLGGGRRVVHVDHATDRLAAALKEILGSTDQDGDAIAFVVVEAGELGPRSSLRRLFEDQPGAAALPCYLDEGPGLTRIIKETLEKYGVTATDAALDYLTDHLGADRKMTRAETEKLALFVGKDGEADLDAAMACVGDSASRGLDDLVFAAAGGRQRDLDRILQRLFFEGTGAITVLRAANRHFQRLHYVSGMITGGTSPDSAMGALRPKVFFKYAPAFRSQLGRWPPRRIASALEILLDAERACKTTGAPAAAICARALMRIAHAAGSARTAGAAQG
ncbi:MAG: DNA polymerase III subunit delta [Alphaproteobacteria bacterium]